MKGKQVTKFYVTMTDSFLSGWGRAKGKTNKLIFECENYTEAEKVKDYADTRTEMKYVNICINRPTRYNGSGYLTQYKTKQECPEWYNYN
jgi:hypothetical protein